MKTNQLRAQLITKNAQGQAIKRSFAKLRTDLTDDEFKTLADAIGTLLSGEKPAQIRLTATGDVQMG